MADLTCCHVNARTTEFCGKKALVVVAIGTTGVGACRAHAGQVLLWWMNGESGDPGEIVTAVPAWRWDAYEEICRD